MNKNIKQLYFLIKNRKVVLVDSNLKNFVDYLPSDLQGIRNYMYYVRKFSKSEYFEFEFNREYVLQRIDFRKEDDEQ